MFCESEWWGEDQLFYGVGIHKHFGARKKTGSELIFLKIDFKIGFSYSTMLFTNNVNV
jgi:hypothetical protein